MLHPPDTNNIWSFYFLVWAITISKIYIMNSSDHQVWLWWVSFYVTWRGLTLPLLIIWVCLSVCVYVLISEFLTFDVGCRERFGLRFPCPWTLICCLVAFFQKGTIVHSDYESPKNGIWRIHRCMYLS